MKRRREQVPEQPLSETEVKFLLGGFDQLPSSLHDLPGPEGDRIFTWFLDGAAAVFEQHREFLLAEARRLGIRPVYRHANGQEYYYAQRMPPGGNRLVTDDPEDEDA
jgi:hypothetical protein